jgi:polar amino acid transport system substrate-binding protein
LEVVLTTILNCIALVLLCFFGFEAVAAPVCPNGPIVVGVQEVGILFHEGVGLDKDVIDELQRRSKCEFSLKTMPRVRIFIELEAGLIDMTTSVMETPERLKFLWVFNYFQTEFYAVGLQKNAKVFRTIEDFVANPDAPKLGVVRGFAYGSVLDALVARLAAKKRLEEVGQIELLFKMLAADRMPAILASPMAYRKILADEGLEDQVVIVDWDTEGDASPRGLAFSKKIFSEQSAKEWGLLVEAMNRDGTMKRLIGKYLSKQETQDALLKSVKPLAH